MRQTRFELVKSRRRDLSFDQMWSLIPSGDEDPGGRKSDAGTRISLLPVFGSWRTKSLPPDGSLELSNVV